MARHLSDADAGAAMASYGLAGLRGIEPTARTLQVAVGDLLAVGVVLTAGLARHSVDPLDAPTHAALVVGPFFAGWALAAPLAGVYARSTLDARRAMFLSTAAAWVAAALVGVAIRATPALPGSSPPVFVAVVTGFGLLGLLAWRTALLALGVVGR